MLHTTQSTELLTGAEYLLNQMEFCKNELKVSCNDGAVHINVKTLNFSYVGSFGTLVHRKVLDNRVSNDTAKKLIILTAYMSLYSKHNGGFTLIPL